ncbi:MAG TPA: hypothetical protein VF590_15670 [Isosphaeraceae bacterium]
MPREVPTAKPIFGEELRRLRAEVRAQPERERAERIVRRMLRSVPDKNRITKPLAAYRLGHLSRAAWMWHQVFWTMPWYEGTDDGVPFAVDQLQEACLVLSREVHPIVFRELARVFGDLKNMTEILVEAYRQTGCHGSGTKSLP